MNLNLFLGNQVVIDNNNRITGFEYGQQYANKLSYTKTSLFNLNYTFFNSWQFNNVLWHFTRRITISSHSNTLVIRYLQTSRKKTKLTASVQRNILMKRWDRKKILEIRILKGGAFKQPCAGVYFVWVLEKENKSMVVLFSYLPLTSVLIDNGCQNEIWRAANEKEIRWTILFFIYCGYRRGGTVYRFRCYVIFLNYLLSCVEGWMFPKDLSTGCNNLLCS